MTVYNIVTNAILEQLEQGVIPWHRPWKTEGAAINYITRKEYSGINRLLLGGGEYMTFKQASELGGKIKKGSKATKIVFYKILEKKNENEEVIKRIPMLRYYNVFALNQVEGIDSKLEPVELYDNDPIQAAEEVVTSYTAKEKIQVKHEDPNRAYYDSMQDYINVPDLNRFEQPEEYYSTLLHEAAHSTGHESRLNRNISTSFGSHAYSKEELTAEIAAAYLIEYTGIDLKKVVGNTAAYIKHWSARLKEDPKLIVQSAAASEKACNFILGKELVHEA